VIQQIAQSFADLGLFRTGFPSVAGLDRHSRLAEFQRQQFSDQTAFCPVDFWNRGRHRHADRWESRKYTATSSANWDANFAPAREDFSAIFLFSSESVLPAGAGGFKLLSRWRAVSTPLT
jgi:hypothetical protein